MKSTFIILSFVLLFSCQSKKSESNKEKRTQTFFVGTYTKGESEGIYKCSIDKDGTLKQLELVAKTINPAFLTFTADKQFLLSVNSNGPENGDVSSFRIMEDSLDFINKCTSSGTGPCFVAANNKGYVIATNYKGGNCCLLKINDEGELSGPLDVKDHTGSEDPALQKLAHPHSAWFEPDSKKIVIADLGTNELWFYKIDTVINKLIPTEQNKISMAPGAGPRHLTFHPNSKWMYVLNELDCTVTQLEKSDDGIYKAMGSISTLPSDYTEKNTCADIHISSEGNFLYASNRGHNSLAIYRVAKEDGKLSIITTESTRGETPRNFSLSPNDEFVVVANQNTNNIVSFKRDATTGLLSFVSEIKAPSPVCILFEN